VGAAAVCGNAKAEVGTRRRGLRVDGALTQPEFVAVLERRFRVLRHGFVVRVLAVFVGADDEPVVSGAGAGYTDAGFGGSGL